MADPLHDKSYEIFRLMLIDARIARDLQQVELAELLKKPQSYVSKSESGVRRVDFAEFMSFAAALDIDIGEFSNQYRLKVANISPDQIQSATIPRPRKVMKKRVE
ncbi:helix-turn-helix domain-containing protein [Duganella sp. CY15W]|uniref:helix-turn-helix domain-containing protein n=1 Tax=Duganella sp. CY15W TaxID=2692172 RepID=UPI00136D983F|nr:helix-turn-helix transcriptional regulator [Duganella sp. CY15W]MYM29288.1 helix-turn-helix domain-containing protein [Duganella sp. CY15W]